jgi:predicted SAM-dependent methyltransferase
MWHVLEHVPDLNNRIEEIKSLLKQSGVLLIAVPNSSALDALHYKQYWAAYDVPRHLYHFTPITMQKLFTKHGFVLAQTLPMHFDSFYVSLLSEKYMHGKSRVIPAVINGVRSNLSAMNSGNYSSLIYVFKLK